MEGGECDDSESTNTKSGLGIVGLQLYCSSKKKRERRPSARKPLKTIASRVLTWFTPISWHKFERKMIALLLDEAASIEGFVDC